MPSIDPLRLQRLVDGELSLNETQSLLREAESDPEYWRSIAGAFIENQIWTTQFVDDDEMAKRFLVQSQRRKARASANASRSGLMWLALSASVLLAFTLGILATQSFDSSNRVGDATLVGNNDSHHSQSVPMESVEMPEQPMLAQHDRSGGDLNQTPAVYRMQVNDESGNQFLDSEVPLYSGKQADAQRWLSDVDVPVSVQRRLADSGYQVQQHVRYLSGQFQDGRMFVIPVRKYNFSSGQ